MYKFWHLCCCFSFHADGYLCPAPLFLLGMANYCFYIWCLWQIRPAGRENTSSWDEWPCPPGDWMCMLHLLTQWTTGILWLSSQACNAPGVEHWEASPGSPTWLLCQEQYCKLLSLKSNKLGAFAEWGSVGIKRSCFQASTVQISKATFKVADHLSYSNEMHCKPKTLWFLH